jgi:hypothetical protein
MAMDAQRRLFEALKAHTFETETERDRASERDQVALDRRIGGARKLLEWLSTTLEPCVPDNANTSSVKRCG